MKNMQLKEYRKGIKVLEIVKTPGTFDGAQFRFLDLLKDKAEKEVVQI